MTYGPSRTFGSSLITIVIIFAAIWSTLELLGVEEAYASCIRDEDWPEKPCLDEPPYSEEYLRQMWQQYYDYKGNQWMGMKKTEMDGAIGNGTLRIWVDTKSSPNNFANHNVWSYYYINGQAPDAYPEPESNSPKQGLTPQLLYNNTWKISNADGPADWSPTEDILVVSTWAGFEPRVMLYGANGTRLMTIAEFKHGEFVSSVRFSPNGSKIAFTHTMPPDSSSQLAIFDLKTRITQNFQFQGNFTDFDWMPDGNHIIYLMLHPNFTESDVPAYQLRIHDPRTGSENVIDSITNAQYSDLSQDGTTLLLVRQLIGQQPCEINIDGNCYADEIVTLKLGQNNSNNTSTESHGEQTGNSPYIISSKVVWRHASLHSVAFPRWVLNDSAIVFSIGNYRCGGPMFAISPDGTRSQNLSSADLNGACDEKGGVFNRDGTIMAYAKSNGIEVANTNFNPVNSGLYLTFTELCKSKQCTPPTNTIPFIKEPAQMVTQPISQYGSPQYNMFLSVGYESLGLELNEKAKTLAMTLQGPRANDWIGERDVMLYLPSSLLDGDMTILVNGTQFFPASTPSQDCLSTGTEEFCSKIKANIDKIDGWSIVNITDSTTEYRSAVSIEIVGTTVTPEFGPILTFLLASMIGVAAISARWLRTK